MKFCSVLYDLFKLERCQECQKRKLRFSFPLLNYNGIDYCRPCYNSIVAPKTNSDWIDYYVSFNPVRDIVEKFRYWIKERE